MFGRRRLPEMIRRSALEVGARKVDEGCAPCAEAYFALAEQHGASDEAISGVRLGRRAILARAGMAAGALSVLSLTDPSALLAAPARTDQPKLEPVSARQAGALLGQARQHAEVRALDLGFTALASLSAYHVKDAGALVIRSENNCSLVAVLAQGDAHSALYVGETAYRAAAGTLREDAALTQRFRALRRTSNERAGDLASTVAHLLSPAEAAAACPACPQLLGACALGAEACRRGCGPCCAVGAAACLAAAACCAQPG
jgi:hypothetical protein